MGVKRPFLHTTAEAGEIAPHLLKRPDDDTSRVGAKRMRNAWLLNGGKVRRKPGESVLADNSTNQSRVVVARLTGGLRRWLVLYNTAVKIYEDDGTLEDTVTSCPWTTAQLSKIRIAADASTVSLVHPSWHERVLTRASGGTWTIAEATYDTGVSGKTLRPFYKFPDTSGVTMTPNAYTGSSKTLTASANYFTSDMAGDKMLLLGKQVNLTTYGSATSFTIDIDEDLYELVDVTVATSAHFLDEQVVQGSITGFRGVVKSRPSATTVRVQMINSYDLFDVATPEQLVGPDTAQNATAAAVVATPGAVLDWKEQLESDERGFAGTICFHDARRVKAGFDAAPAIFAASAAGATKDYDVGSADDADAIVDSIGGQSTEKILHLESKEQLQVFTDQRSVYYPQDKNNPFTPTNVSVLGFVEAAAEGCSATCAPASVDEGVVWVNATGTRVKLSRPTGNSTASWEVLQLGDLAPHLISDPVEIAVIEGCPEGSTYQPERHVAAINDDGTCVVMRYRLGSEIVGWNLWEASDTSTVKYTSIAHDNGETRFIIQFSTKYRLCKLTFDAFMVGEYDYSSAQTDLNGETVVVMKNGVHHASGLVASGEVAGTAAASGLTVGYPRKFEYTPNPAYDDEYMGYHEEITKVVVHLLDAQGISVNGEVQLSYRLDEDDFSAAPPIRTWTHRFEPRGLEEEFGTPAVSLSDMDRAGVPQMFEVTVDVVTGMINRGGD